MINLYKLSKIFNKLAHDNEYIREDDYSQDDFENALEIWKNDNLGPDAFPASIKELLDVRNELEKEIKQVEQEDDYDGSIPYFLKQKIKLLKNAIRNYYDHFPPYDKEIK